MSLIPVMVPTDDLWPDAAYVDSETGIFAIPVSVNSPEGLPNGVLILTPVTALQLAQTLTRLVS